MGGDMEVVCRGIWRWCDGRGYGGGVMGGDMEVV